MGTVTATLIALLGSTAVSASPHVDHIILGVSNFQTGITQVERLTGVRPALGGVHPGKGTRNALISLGDGTYLELLALDPAQHVRSEEVKLLRKLRRPAILGWAISGPDINVLRRRAAATGLATTAPQPGSRRLPNGRTLKWQLFGYDGYDDSTVPFFIAWADPQLHPSRTSPHGCKFKSLSIEEPNAGKLRRAIAPFRLKVHVTRAAKAKIKLGLVCPKGELGLG